MMELFLLYEESRVGVRRLQVNMRTTRRGGRASWVCDVLEYRHRRRGTKRVVLHRFTRVAKCRMDAKELRVPQTQSASAAYWSISSDEQEMVATASRWHPEAGPVGPTRFTRGSESAMFSSPFGRMEYTCIYRQCRQWIMIDR